MTRAQIPVLLAFVGLAVTVVLMIGRIAASPRPEVELASFATSLRGRTENQRHNAMLSANDLHNEVILPGGVPRSIKL